MLRDSVSPLARRVRQEKPGDVAISAIVAHELFYGAFKSARASHNVALVDTLQFPVVKFDREDARQVGEIRAFLAARGMAVGPYDVLIADQAIVRDMILITRNSGEFGRLPGLQIEDWES
jgi:tRNA(fMet)-specific endonuclease VapC